jgi:two-component system response regulator AtoC
MLDGRLASPKRVTEKRASRIAVLERDPAVLSYIGRTLAPNFSVSQFTKAAEFNQYLADSPSPDLAFIDWRSSGDETDKNPLNVLSKAHCSRPSLPIVILACSLELNSVMEAARQGAREVLLKPFNKGDIMSAVGRFLGSGAKQTTPVDEGVAEIPLNEEISFVRSSRRMREIEMQCRLVARADLPVLILGESGTGKEVIAMLIHKYSSRDRGKFLKVNCAAMPADLLESELFGYEQGAFTGALKSKPGKFEICDRGTIFLDEIGEMPPALQAKLLQVLQDGSFSRLGGRSSVKVDVRVIAATNVDIKAAIARKTFREDLFYRLNGLTLKMPPLRERREEIPIFIQHFMRKGAAKYDRSPLPISPALMRALTMHEWPGNIRELENTIKRYLVLGNEEDIIGELVPAHSTGAFSEEMMHANGGLKHLVRNVKGGAECVAIAQTLETTGWNRKAAATNLKISYKALLYKIKQYNLSPSARPHQ